MPYHIPNDWENRNWVCIKIMWPNSRGWLSILRSVLYTMARGRTWDKATGSIRDTQVIGWDIFDRNWPFNPCDSDNGNGQGGGIGGGIAVGSGWCDDPCESEDCMPSGPCPPIRINDAGVLQYYWCCQWVDIGTVGGAPAEVDTDVLPPPDDPPVDLACRKAYVMAEGLDSLASAGFDNKGAVGPFDFANSLRAAFPALELSKWRLYEAYGYLIAGTIMYLANWTEAWGITNQQGLVCSWRDLLGDETNTISHDEFAAMKTAMKQRASAVTESYLEALMNAVGVSGFSWLAASSVTREGVSCACPELINDPREDLPEYITWAEWKDLRNGMPPDTSVLGTSEHVPGLGVLDYPTATGIMNAGIGIDSRTWDASTDVEWIYILWYNVATNDYQGVHVRISSPATELHQGVVPDLDPSVGGKFTYSEFIDYSLVPAGDAVDWEVECRSTHGDDIAYTAVIQAIGIGGTGADPELGW